MTRASLPLCCIYAALALVGCDVRVAPFSDRGDVGAPVGDAGPRDGSVHDASLVHDAGVHHDAHVTHDAGHDAHVAHDAGHDAHVTHDAGHDAHVAHDAYVCPTWTHDVQPLLRRHCGGCHTTVVPAFVSSRSTAHSYASAIISAGTSPGSMAHNDPLGGFSHADDALLHAWVACGAP